MSAPAGVLFDLDGTLLDTAPDLSAPINAMLRERGQPELPEAELRPFVSAGARGLLGRSFGLGPGDEGFAALGAEFLQRYERDIVVHTRFFEGMEALLEQLDADGIAWGVVSNKVERLVRLIGERIRLRASGLSLNERAAVMFGGDTAARPKPAPDPLLLAASHMGLNPATMVYVGDDLRDIQAGHAAGMKTVATSYGYCGGELPVQQWGADWVVDSPQALQALLRDMAPGGPICR